ncbi:MAG: hypothetical protein ACI8RZ_004216 [Myxococcota bacterium]
MTLPLLIACTGADPEPAENPADSGVSLEDTGDTTAPPDGFTLGDPITTTGFMLDVVTGYEWTDAVMLDASTALLGGVTGYGIFDVDTAELIGDYREARSYRVDAHNGLAIVVERTEPPLVIDVSDPRNPSDHARGSGDMRDGTAYQDVAIHDGLILIGWQEQGARFFSDRLNELGTFPGEQVFAVELFEDRALITDLDALILLDVTDPSAPTEITRTDLPGEGRDLSVSGSHVAVGMGGLGVMVFDLTDDVLTPRGQVTPPGSSTGVSIDGDYLWIAGWEQVALAWLGEGGPVVLGHEEPSQSAMGIGAGFGRAVVGDWYAASALAVNEGVGGPELVIEDTLWFTEGGSSQSIRIRNNGIFDLTLSLEAPTTGFSAEAADLTLAPGESHTLTITPPDTRDEGPGLLAYTSNDPDEQSGVIELDWTSLGVGSTHPDFSMQGFTLPDKTLSTFTLSDYEGQAVYLAYWAMY